MLVFRYCRPYYTPSRADKLSYRACPSAWPGVFEDRRICNTCKIKKLRILHIYIYKIRFARNIDVGFDCASIVLVLII